MSTASPHRHVDSHVAEIPTETRLHLLPRLPIEWPARLVQYPPDLFSYVERCHELPGLLTGNGRVLWRQSVGEVSFGPSVSWDSGTCGYGLDFVDLQTADSLSTGVPRTANHDP